MLFNSYKNEIETALNNLNYEIINTVINEIISIRNNRKTIYLLGNGGSAATANHMATDLMFGSKIKNPSLKAISLVGNSSILTATGNDVGFEQIFLRQLEQLINHGDLVILISASGNSPNIIKVAEFTSSQNIKTIGFTGFDGGKLLKMTDISVHVPTSKGKYGIVEDIHSIIGHMITEKLKLLEN